MSETKFLNTLVKSFIQKQRDECKDHFYSFFKLMFWTVCKEEYVYNWHLEYLCNELEIIGKRIIARQPKLYDLIINISPGETKTILVSQLFHAWLLTNDPRIRCISSSHTHTLSVKNSMKTKDCLTSEKYNRIFEPIKFKYNMDGKGAWMTDEGGERLSTSVGSSVTGEHAHLKIGDDLIDASKIYSNTEIKAANEHIDALASRNTDKKITVNILIMQRLSINDPTAYALTKWQNVKHIVIPAEDKYRINPPELKAYYVNGLMNPKRTDKEYLLHQENEELGITKYNAQFGQSPNDTTGKILKESYFTLLKEDEFLNNLDKERRASFMSSKVFALADLAYTAKEKNDPSGLLIIKYWENSLYLLDFYEWYLEAPDLLEKVSEIYERDDLEKVAIENKASGMSIAQLLRVRGINAIDYIQTNKDKKARLVDKLAFIQALRVKFLITPINEKRLSKMLSYLISFPDNAVPDEAIDTLVMAINSVDRKIRQL